MAAATYCLPAPVNVETKRKKGGHFHKKTTLQDQLTSLSWEKTKSSTQKCRLGWDISSSQDTLWDQPTNRH